MPYYEDMFGNLHYHEPAGTEATWLTADPTSGFIDPGLAQVKKEFVTDEFITKLSAQTPVTRKSGEVVGGAPVTDTRLSPVQEMMRGDIAREGLKTAGLPALIGLGASLPGIIGGIAGVGGAIYGGLQALGLGEGGGLFGINVLGGDDFNIGGIEFGGPGLPEPAAKYVIKEWHVSYSWGRLQYYMVQVPGQRRKIALYNTKTKRWKVWTFTAPRLAVIGKNMPSHRMIVRLRKNLKKHSADARTILKMTSPGSLSSGSRPSRPPRRSRYRR